MRSKANGVSMVEYAILLALIAVAVATSFPVVTSALVQVFGRASSVMTR